MGCSEHLAEHVPVHLVSFSNRGTPVFDAVVAGFVAKLIVCQPYVVLTCDSLVSIVELFPVESVHGPVHGSCSAGVGGKPNFPGPSEQRG